MYYLSIFAFYTHFYMVICLESCAIFLAKKALAYILMPVHTLGHTQTSIFCRVWTRLWHLWLHTPGAGHYLATWNERLCQHLPRFFTHFLQNGLCLLSSGGRRKIKRGKDRRHLFLKTPTLQVKCWVVKPRREVGCFLVLGVATVLRC